MKFDINQLKTKDNLIRIAFVVLSIIAVLMVATMTKNSNTPKINENIMEEPGETDNNVVNPGSDITDSNIGMDNPIMQEGQEEHITYYDPSEIDKIEGVDSELLESDFIKEVEAHGGLPENIKILEIIPETRQIKYVNEAGFVITFTAPEYPEVNIIPEDTEIVLPEGYTMTDDNRIMDPNGNIIENIDEFRHIISESIDATKENKG